MTENTILLCNNAVQGDRLSWRRTDFGDRVIAKSFTSFRHPYYKLFEHTISRLNIALVIYLLLIIIHRFSDAVHTQKILL